MKKTEFKDVAPFYVNTEVQVTSLEDGIKSIDTIDCYSNECLSLKKWGDWYFDNDDVADVKLILHPLSGIYPLRTVTLYSHRKASFWREGKSGESLQMCFFEFGELCLFWFRKKSWCAKNKFGE